MVQRKADPSWPATATDAELEELQRYNGHCFDLAAVEKPLPIPMNDEPFVACWLAWEEEAREKDILSVLLRYIPQLHFPIRQGISKHEDYRAAVLRGQPVEGLDLATGLPPISKERLQLEVHSSLAGRIPVLLISRRQEFVLLAQALAKKNEPVRIPPAQGAIMIAGFSNWERIRQLKRRWQTLAPEERTSATWPQEFALVREKRELYQDRFMLLSDGPYSAVAAADLALDESHWRELSLTIRREHECAHYMTRRVFGTMKNHPLDELIADYAGLVAACGHFRADWFLRFIGLEDYPHYRAGARLDLYRGDPPLSDGAFRTLHEVLHDAALNLERFDHRMWASGDRKPLDRAAMLLAIGSLRLDQLASREASSLLQQAFEQCSTFVTDRAA